MSIAAIPGLDKDRRLATRRRLDRAKIGFAFLLALLLLYLGFQGRRHAIREASLSQIALVRDQLQQKLDDEHAAAGSFGGGGTNAIDRPSSDPQVADLVSTLQTRLGQFDTDYRQAKLSEIESLEIRLSQATLANAEQRFTDALQLVTGNDEKAKPAPGKAQIGRLIRLHEVRGDSFYGLHDWQNALARYRQVLNLQPNRIAPMARAAQCQYALGSLNEAQATFAELAETHNNRGDTLLVEGKPDAAIRHYATAVEIETRLIEQGRHELEPKLATSHSRRGDALLFQGKLDVAIGDFERSVKTLTRLVEQQGHRELAYDLEKSLERRGNVFLFQGKLDAAIGDFDNAIKILTRLVNEEGLSELAYALAMSHHNRGNAFLAQGKLDAAIGDLENAITTLTRLLEQEWRGELAGDLARSYNNHGVVRRAQGQPESAIGDFENAVKILTGLVEKGGRRELANDLAVRHNNSGIVRRAQVKLEVAMGYSENALDALLRTRLINQGTRKELAILLAVSLKNRGYARLVQGKADGAIGDFMEALEICARLVEQEGEKDLAPQLVKSLSALAWVYATNPDKSFRDGSKAKAFALRACQLSEWKAFGPVETLAAACAETGNFAEAVTWQAKALELAPAKFQTDQRSRLERYKSGNPYRAQAKAE